MRLIEIHPKRVLSNFLDSVRCVVWPEGKTAETALLMTVDRLLSEDLPSEVVLSFDGNFSTILNPRRKCYPLFELYKITHSKEVRVFIIDCQALSIRPTSWTSAENIYKRELHEANRFKEKHKELIREFVKGEKDATD